MIKKITALLTALIIAFTLCGCTAGKISSAKNGGSTEAGDTESSSAESSTEEVSLSEEEPDYDSVEAEIDEIAEEKGFSDDVKDEIYGILELIKNNYADNYEIFRIKGLPALNEFINDVFLGSLRAVKEIDFVDLDNEELAEYNADGLCFDDGRILIGFCEGNRGTDLLRIDMFEEIIHAGQYSVSSRENDRVQVSDFEGEAAFYRNLISDEIQHVFYDPFDNGDNTGYQINGASVDTYGIYGKTYFNFLCMTDYDTMQEYKRTTDLNVISDAVREKYGFDCKDTIKDFLYMSYDTDGKSACSIIYDFENLLYDCLLKDFENISSKSECIGYMSLYRHYILHYMTTVYNTEDYYSYLITDTVFDRSRLTDALYEKACSYDVLNRLSDSDETNRKIFDYVFTYENTYIITSCPITDIKILITYNPETYYVMNKDSVMAYEGVFSETQYYRNEKFAEDEAALNSALVPFINT